MRAEGARLGWHWVIAAVTPDGVVHFLDPRKGRARRGITLTSSAAIDNLLLWLDRVTTPRPRRGARRVTGRAGSARGSRYRP